MWTGIPKKLKQIIITTIGDDWPTDPIKQEEKIADYLIDGVPYDFNGKLVDKDIAKFVIDYVLNDRPINTDHHIYESMEILYNECSLHIITFGWPDNQDDHDQIYMIAYKI